MEKQFDRLVEKDIHGNSFLYHGTSATDAAKIRDEGINLRHCRRKTDFNGSRGFYVTANYKQALKWAKKIVKKGSSTNGEPDEPDVVYFYVDLQELAQLFNYKRFNVGEYKDWLKLTQSSRKNVVNEFDIVEGPFSAKNKNKFNKPVGHQIGIFSEDVVDYFNDHYSTSYNQIISCLKNLNLI